MQRIVVAVKAGEQQLWLADAAAERGQADGRRPRGRVGRRAGGRGLSTVPRSELAALAQEAVDPPSRGCGRTAWRRRARSAPGRSRAGSCSSPRSDGADVIVCGASSRGPVATRVLGSVPMELVQRARRPVLIITPPHGRRRVLMATAQEGGGLFVTKPVDALVADTEDSEHKLERAVGALDLTALGLGAIIGTGIFVVIGEAIGDAGPGDHPVLRARRRHLRVLGADFAELASRSRWPAAPTRTPTRPWASSWPGSSAGT